MKLLIKLKTGMLMLFALGAFSKTYAGIDNVVMEGMVISYDKKTVTISQKGKKIKVPRSSIPKHIKLKTGKMIEVPVSNKKLMKKIKHARIAGEGG